MCHLRKSYFTFMDKVGYKDIISLLEFYTKSDFIVLINLISQVFSLEVIALNISEHFY